MGFHKIFMKTFIQKEEFYVPIFIFLISIGVSMKYMRTSRSKLNLGCYLTFKLILEILKPDNLAFLRTYMIQIARFDR